MIEKEAFTAGLAVIALQCGKALSQETSGAYYLAFAEETDPEEWSRFCPSAAKTYGWRFLPTVPELMDALQQARGAKPVEVEAGHAYDAVLRAGDYNPEAGTRWSYRSVLEKCGRAAADAFIAAGGHNAFAAEYQEAQRRAAFTGAYKASARVNPAGRLPTGKATYKSLAGLAPDMTADKDAATYTSRRDGDGASR